MVDLCLDKTNEDFMKICVYTDVHSNIEALENLMKTEDYKTADLRVFLGDAVAVCPYPNECIETILKSGDVWLMGNHDCYFAYGLPVEEYPYFQGDKKVHQDYMRDLVKKENLKVLKNLPREFKFEQHGIRFHFAHFPWESETLVVNEPDLYNGDSLDRLFADVDADYIFFGHEHKSILVKTEKSTYVCVDSLGVKHLGNYVMIEIGEDGSVTFERKKIDFDLKKLKEEMLKRDYPWAVEYTRYIVEE